MNVEKIAGMELFYDPAEQDAARIIGAAMEKSAALLSERWGLTPPRDCQVYVMTFWMSFLFQSAPWLWKAYLALIMPMISWRASEIWAAAGGWSLQFGGRRVVGIKPPRLMQTGGSPGNRRLGEQFYVEGISAAEKVEIVTCHELVHAFTFHLRLPTWLHEGVATLAMEHFRGRPVVRVETLDTLIRPAPSAAERGAEKARVWTPPAILAQYALGYWLTRYIEETHPDLLNTLLSQRMRHAALEETVAAAFGKDRATFWEEIGEELRKHYA
jgi:hypothetical protein